MVGITQGQRLRAWNVQLLVGIGAIAGFYQRDDFLSIADVSSDLDKCLRFPQPEGTWQPVLLPIDLSRRDARAPRLVGSDDSQVELTVDREPFILLDDTDMRPFPTPATGYRTRYRYAFHSASCDNPRHHGQTGMLLGDAARPFPHPFPYTDACIRQAGAPARRRDPRYLPIRKKCTDERLQTAPLRNSKKRKASSDSGPTHSSARSSSQVTSDIGTESRDEEVPAQIIPVEKARPLVDKFRANVLTGGAHCAVTGKGDSWLGTGNIGPGIEAAHIVPQCHWNTYPIDEGQRVADRDAKQQLEQAWRLTWMLGNGLPLLSHIHKCFEARLLSIHPTTYRIRTFAWYDVINEYHGQVANVSADVDPKALQHHWDMCCLENIVAESVTDAPESPSDMHFIPASATPVGPSGAPVATPAASFLPTSSLENHGQSTPRTKDHQRHVARDVQPLSPPSSDTLVQVTRWQVGNEVISDPKAAERLRTFGWEVKELRTLAQTVNTTRAVNRWRIGREVITDPEVAERLRSLGWELEEMPKETGESSSRPRKRQRLVPSWRIGAHIIEDEYEARRLRDQGWIVEDVLDDNGGRRGCEDEGEGEDDSYVERGRPRKRRSAGQTWSTRQDEMARTFAK